MSVSFSPKAFWSYVDYYLNSLKKVKLRWNYLITLQIFTVQERILYLLADLRCLRPFKFSEVCECYITQTIRSSHCFRQFKVDSSEHYWNSEVAGMPPDFPVPTGLRSGWVSFKSQENRNNDHFAQWYQQIAVHIDSPVIIYTWSLRYLLILMQRTIVRHTLWHH